MNKTELLELEKVSGLTPKKLENTNPGLYSLVLAKAIDQISAFIDDYFRTSPKNLRGMGTGWDLFGIMIMPRFL